MIQGQSAEIADLKARQQSAKKKKSQFQRVPNNSGYDITVNEKAG